MFKCEYCGGTLPEYKQFCPFCGGRIDAIENKISLSADEQLLEYQLVIEYENYKQHKKAMRYKQVVGIIGLITFIFFMVYLFSDDTVQPTSSKVNENKTLYDYITEIDKDSTNIEAYEGLIRKYLEMGALDMVLIEIDNLFRIQKDNAELYKEISRQLIRHNYKQEAVSILMRGYAHTDNEVLKEMRNNIALAEAIESSAFKQALELMYQKPISEINWSDINQIKYINLKASTLQYSFEDRDQYEDVLRFENTIQEVAIEETFKSVKDIILFEGVVELHTAARNKVYMRDIESLSQLKRLHVGRIYNSKDLKDFNFFKNLQVLSVGGNSLESLEGIAELKNLKEISLQDTAITNLSILSTLKNITTVRLYKNKNLQSLATLGSMNHLKELSISGNEVKDLSFLKNLNNLERLEIIDTDIKSAEFLAAMPELKLLRFESNDKIKDISAIAGNTKLEELYLNCRNLSGINSLKKLINMKKLTLTGLNDLKVISEFVYLTHLNLHSCEGVNNLNALSHLTELEYLNLSNNSSNIGNLKPLANLKKLKYLDLSENSLYHAITPIFGLSELLDLNLQNTYIEKGLIGIEKLSKLRELNLNNAKLIANTFIQSDGFATYIDYDKVEMDKHTKYLSNLSQLEVLRLNKTNLTDTSFLKTLKNIQVLDLSNNYITDISFLNHLSYITYIDVRNNAISDFTFLEQYTNAIVLGK